MPDLSTEGVQDFMKTLTPDSQRTLVAHGRREDWVVDREGSLAESKIVEFGSVYDRELARLGPGEVAQRLVRSDNIENLRIALAYTGILRRTVLLNALAGLPAPDGADLTIKLISAQVDEVRRQGGAGQAKAASDAVAVIRESLLLMERRRILRQIFDKERIRKVLSALRGDPVNEGERA